MFTIMINVNVMSWCFSFYAVSSFIWINGMVTVRSIGSSGTVHGGMTLNAGTQPFASSTRTASGDPAGSATSTVVIDTTATKLIELTAVTAAGTTSVNFLQASITKIRP